MLREKGWRGWITTNYLYLCSLARRPPPPQGNLIQLLHADLISCNTCFISPAKASCCISFLLLHNKLPQNLVVEKGKEGPDPCGSIGWMSSHKAKGHLFDSQSGHMPGSQVQSVVGGMQEATDRRFSQILMFLSLFHPPFPSL